MAAYRRVDDLRSPAGWLPVHWDQLQAQHSVSSMGSLYLYLFTCPTGATRCTDWGEIWHGGPLFHAKFSPNRCKISLQGPKTENFYKNFTKFQNINVLQRHIHCAIFTKFAAFAFAVHLGMHSLLKFGWMCSRDYRVMGVSSCGSGFPQSFSAPWQ